MRKNVLIFPCGTEIGLELHKSLSSSTHIELFGASSTSDHGEYVYDNYTGGAPFIDENNFTEWLNDFVSSNHIEFIIPAHDSVLLKLAQEKSDGNLNCEVVTSPLEVCEITRSKSKTYEAFANIIPTPKVYKQTEQIKPEDFPLFLKPDVGQGSKGTYVAHNKDEIEFYTKKDQSLLVLEYLPGKEYTVDCFSDKYGKLRLSEGRERTRITNGISVRSINVDNPRFKLLADKINDTLNLRGAWFFQVKENITGELVLMAIAPRVAGTMGLLRNKGVNLPLLSLFDAMGYDVEVFKNTCNITIDRALQNIFEHNIDYEHVYLDFDDIVIFDGKVNPSVMAFVYQCRNNKVVIHLLTKHRLDLVTTLKDYRLESIFDEVIWIKEEDEKHAFINESKAIFIDDSFVERKKVHDKLGIPVFDAHMIEGLMEKF